MREIRRRIRSVQNTQQITRAMQMIAAVKLRKTQEKVLAGRPYAEKLREVMGRLAAEVQDVTHPFFEARPEKKIGIMLFTSDRGLCGGYNTNMIRLAAQRMVSFPQGTEINLLTVGRKGREYFRHRGVNIFRDYVDLGDEPDFTQARELAREIERLYLKGEWGAFYLAYTRFFSPVQHMPDFLKLLPCEKPAAPGRSSDYIFEPARDELLALLLPRYLEVQVYQMFLEAKASEHGARMTAMDAATDNAAEMIKSLTLSFNKARQAAITKELTEIVGGAEALRVT